MTNFILVIVIIAFFVLLVTLALRSGRRYSVHDTESHATEYAGVIKEGHGGLTTFLWLSFGSIIVFTIFYLVEHSREFSVLFRMIGGS